MGPPTNLLALATLMAMATGCAGGASTPQPGSSSPGRATHAVPRLVCDHTRAKPGSKVQVGVRFQIEPGWHLYWNGRNDSGYAPLLTLRAPVGYTVGSWRWPAPRRLEQPGGLVDHIYEGTVMLTTEVTLPATARPGDAFSMSFRGEWLACRSACEAEQGQGELRVAIGEARTNGTLAAEFSRTVGQIPLPWPLASDMEASTEGEAAVFRVPGARRLEFYPGEDCAQVADILRDGAGSGSTLRVRIAGAGPVRGVLRVEPGEGARAACFAIDIPGPPREQETPGQPAP